jgi:hypothetical protein
MGNRLLVTGYFRSSSMISAMPSAGFPGTKISWRPLMNVSPETAMHKRIAEFLAQLRRKAVDQAGVSARNQFPSGAYRTATIEATDDNDT